MDKILIILVLTFFSSCAHQSPKYKVHEGELVTVGVTLEVAHAAFIHGCKVNKENLKKSNFKECHKKATDYIQEYVIDILEMPATTEEDDQEDLGQ